MACTGLGSTGQFLGLTVLLPPAAAEGHAGLGSTGHLGSTGAAGEHTGLSLQIIARHRGPRHVCDDSCRLSSHRHLAQTKQNKMSGAPEHA